MDPGFSSFAFRRSYSEALVLVLVYAVGKKKILVVLQSANSIDTVVISCSWNKVQILSTKDTSSSRTFSKVCLILATCV